MSTRATVYVHGAQWNIVKLYHHCDGYIDWLGSRLIRTMMECGGEDVIPNLFKIGGFEVDDVDSNHSDVEYVYDIHLKRESVEFEGNKYQPIIKWKIEVRKGYGEDKIKQQEGIELGNGWSMKNDRCRSVLEYDKIEEELREIEKRSNGEEDVESLDENDVFYSAYYS